MKIARLNKGVIFDDIYHKKSNSKLELATNYIENIVKNRKTLNHIEATNEYIDNERVFVKRMKFVISESNHQDFVCGMNSINYNPIKYEASLVNAYAMFNANTPRANGSSVGTEQFYTFWNYASDRFIFTSNGFDRTGQELYVDFYFTYK